MTSNKPLIHRLAFTYACSVGAVPVLYNTILVVSDSLVEYYGDDPGRSIKQRAIILLLPVLILVAIYHFKKRNNGFLKFKEGYIIGLEIAIISTATMIVYHVLFNQFLSPSFHVYYYETYGQQRFKELRKCCDYTKEQFEMHKNQRLAYDQGGGLIMKKKIQ